MTEHEHKDRRSKEEGEIGASSLLDTLQENAKSSIFPEISDIVGQYREQKDETKKYIPVEGFTHVVTAIDAILQLQDPTVDSVRISSTTFQANPVPESGDLSPADERVQMRLDHVYALLGSARHIQRPAPPGTLVQLHESPTNLGTNIFAIEERGRNVAVKVHRKRAK